MKKSLVAVLAASTMSVLPATANAAVVTFGNTSGNSINDCTPGCTPQFQTVYTASAFGSSPVSITGISYFLAAKGPQPTYSINLSTSRNPVGSLSSNAASNVATDVATFFSGSPSDFPTTGAWYTFTGTPFLYDPLLGDLLVDFGHTGALDVLTLQSAYNSGVADRQRGFSFSPSGALFVELPGYSIATQFTVASSISAAVPEPATWLTMILGFAVIGLAMRRSQRTGVRFNFA